MGIESLLYIIRDYAPMDKEFIIRAYEFASKIHAGAKRKSGEPYIIHPIAVACIAANMHADVDTIVACLLHDVIEDGDVKREDLEREFNPTVAMLVDGVSKLPKLSFNNDKFATDAFNLRKIFLGTVTDIRIIIIKLADRLHNMRTLEFQPPHKQIEHSEETRDIYAHLAALIGAYNIKQELDDLAFMYLDPKKYLEMKNLINNYRLENFDIIDSALCNVAQLLNSKQVPFEVKLRVKSLYSLARKLEKYTSIEEIHDIFSINYILNDIESCYKLRSEITSRYRVIASKEKDYIATPKVNLYSALHASVYGDNDRLLQFQFTTKQMNLINTHGITAYWDLLKFNHAPEHMQEEVRKMPFFRLIEELTKTDLKNEEFNKEVQEDILEANLTICTPQGHTIQLPKGSTPIDFAYKIHEDIGNWITGAVVNGEKVPLDYVLHQRDIVKIIFNEKLYGPREDLSNMCKTNKAKRKIKEFNNHWSKYV